MTQVSENGHKRAVLYARVSTDEQADKGYSLPSQSDAMRKYAEQQGFEIVGEFQDDYSGATPIEHRPEGRKAYALLQSGGADLIIAYTIDRYVRPPEDGDEWEMPILIRGLAKLGKEIHTVRRGKLNTNFADLLIALLDARKAGEERRDIRERSMRGKRQKVKSGKVVGGRAPYGYQYIRDEHGKVITLEIDETTARIVRLIYQWYVHGDEHGKRLAIAPIAARLSEMGVLTPGETQSGYKRSRASAMWHCSAVDRILKSELYIGTWRFGKKIGDTSKRRPLDETLTASIPAIIDRALWGQAQAQRGRNQVYSPRNTKHEYLLRGLIRCGLCGMKYGGAFSKPKPQNPGNRYYSDIHSKARHEHLEGRCNNKTVRADAIEADIWDEIKELFKDPVKLLAELKAAQQSADEQLKPLHDKLQITDDFIRHFRSEADKIAVALPDAEKGKAVWQSLKQSETNVNARLDELARQREKLVKEIEAGKVTNERIETIMTVAERVRKGIARATPKGKRQILEALNVFVTVTMGKYHLKCIVGEKDGLIRKIKRGGNVSIAARSQTRRH